MIKSITTKQRGDAGEHYVCAMLGFNGIPTAKMPDNWPDYDLIADFQHRQLRIQVKTFHALRVGSWNAEFPQETPFDYLAIVTIDGGIRAWLLPVDVVRNNMRLPGAEVKNQNAWLLTRQLKGELQIYLNNWTLDALGC